MNELTHQKEVNFHDYCPKCVNRNSDQGDDPCNECLTEFTNFESMKPVNFEEDINASVIKRTAKK